MPYAKHIKHIHENLNLTFDDIKNIIFALSSGDVNANEKFDGFNGLLSYSDDTPIIARNTNDTQMGGLNRDALRHRFSGKLERERIFGGGLSAFGSFCENVDKNILHEVFKNGENWVSTEIISPNDFSIIRYSGNHLMIHQNGFSRQSNQKLNEINSNLLFGTLNEAKINLENEEWKIHQPKKIELNKLSKKELNEFAHKLNLIAIKARVSSDKTLKEFLSKWIERKLVQEKRIHSLSKIKMISQRIAGEKISLPELKKGCGKQEVKAIQEYVKNRRGIIAEIMFPLEKLIYEVGEKLFEGKCSALIEDFDAELGRLKEVSKELWGQTKNETKVARYKKIMNDPENISSTIEGVVFEHNGETLKLIGAYHPLNRMKAICERKQNEKKIKEGVSNYLEKIGDEGLERIVKEERERLEELEYVSFKKDVKTKQITIGIFFDPNFTTQSILTPARSIVGATTIYLLSKVMKSVLGRHIALVNVNYLPVIRHMDYIDFFCRSVMKIDGVQIIKVFRIGKKRLTKPLGPIQLVYQKGDVVKKAE